MESTESIAVSTFAETFLGEDVHFYVLKLKESCFIWIGGASASFKTLVAAVTTRMVVAPCHLQLVVTLCSIHRPQSRFVHNC